MKYTLFLLAFVCSKLCGASGDATSAALSSEPVEMTAVPRALADFVRSGESQRNRFLVHLLHDLCEAQKNVRVGGLVVCLERRQFLEVIERLSETVQLVYAENMILREEKLLAEQEKIDIKL